MKATPFRIIAMTAALRPEGWRPYGASEWKAGYLMIGEGLMVDDGVSNQPCLRATDEGTKWAREPRIKRGNP